MRLEIIIRGGSGGGLLILLHLLLRLRGLVRLLLLAVVRCVLCILLLLLLLLRLLLLLLLRYVMRSELLIVLGPSLGVRFAAFDGGCAAARLRKSRRGPARQRLLGHVAAFSRARGEVIFRDTASGCFVFC